MDRERIAQWLQESSRFKKPPSMHEAGDSKPRLSKSMEKADHKLTSNSHHENFLAQGKLPFDSEINKFVREAETTWSSFLHSCSTLIPSEHADLSEHRSMSSRLQTKASNQMLFAQYEKSLRIKQQHSVGDQTSRVGSASTASTVIRADYVKHSGS